MSSSSSSGPDAVATTECDVAAMPTDEVDVVDNIEVGVGVGVELEADGAGVGVGVIPLGCSVFR